VKVNELSLISPSPRVSADPHDHERQENRRNCDEKLRHFALTLSLYLSLPLTLTLCDLIFSLNYTLLARSRTSPFRRAPAARLTQHTHTHTHTHTQTHTPSIIQRGIFPEFDSSSLMHTIVFIRI